MDNLNIRHLNIKHLSWVTAWTFIIAVLLVPSEAEARGHSTVVNAGGMVEITIQGQNGQSRLSMYPSHVEFSATSSGYRHDYRNRGRDTGRRQTVRRSERSRSGQTGYYGYQSGHHHDYHYRDGDYVSWHSNGMRAVQGRMRGGQAQGLWRWYDPRGRVIEERNYHNGRLHGLVRIRHSNGRIAEEYTYMNGRLHGRARTWYESGRIASEQHYMNDMLHGRTRTWYWNGRMASESHHSYGRAIGIWMEWYSDGRLKRRQRYS